MSGNDVKANLRELIFPAAAVLVGALSSVHLLLQEYQSVDYGIFAYGGFAINKGMAIYKDFWDNKPPGIFYLNSMAFNLFGSVPSAIKRLESIFFVLGALAFYGIMRRFGCAKAFSLAGVALFFSLLTIPSFLENGNMTEEYGTFHTLFSIFFILACPGGRTAPRTENICLVLSGIFASSAFLIKEPFILAVPALLLLIWLGSSGRRPFIVRTLLFLAGFASAALLMVLLNVGSLPEWIQVIDYNFHYSAEPGVSPAARIAKGARMFLFWYLPHNAVIFIVMLLALVSWGVKKSWRGYMERLKGREGQEGRERAVLFCGAFFLTCLASVCISGRFFGHYFIIFSAPLALLGGISLEYCWRNIRLFKHFAVVLCAAGLGFALFSGIFKMRDSHLTALMKISGLPGYFFRVAAPAGQQYLYNPERGILVVGYPGYVLKERKFIVDTILASPGGYKIQNYSDFSLVYLLTDHAAASKYYMFFEHFFIDTSDSTGKEKLQGHIKEVKESRPRFIIVETIREIPWISPDEYNKIPMRNYNLFVRRGQ